MGMKFKKLQAEALAGAARDAKGRFAKRATQIKDEAKGLGWDAFRNVAARMGAATASLAEATEYVMERWSNDYWLMLTLWRNHWISRRIVELPANDMVRAWPRIKSEMDPDDISRIAKAIRTTRTPQRVKQALKWARLFGGAGALMVIDGQEDILDQPLDIDSVNPGQYKGLIVFDRWSGITPSLDICTDINRPLDFGLPEYYEVRSNSDGETFKVHCSRILRFTGPDVPSPEFEAQMRWGISVLEICYDEIRKRDNMSWTILQLMFRAQILTQVNPQLASMLSGASISGAGLEQYEKTMQAQNELLSNQSMLILPKDGKLESHQYTFGGVGDIYAQFQMDIAGAAQIPVTRLFGRTITGLGQTNDADERIYEQSIAQMQEDELDPQLQKLYPVICMSELGEVPDDLELEYPSVRVLTEEDKADLAIKATEAILAPFNAGIDGYGSKTVLQEIKQLSDKTEIGTNITDEMIEAAADDDSMQMGEMGADDDAAAAPKGKQLPKIEKPAKGKGKAKDSASTLSLVQRISALMDEWAKAA